MGHDILTQLGLAGLLIYLFLKEMFAFLAKKKNGNGDDKPKSQKSGDLDPAVWEAKFQLMLQTTTDKGNERLMGDIRSLLESRTGMLVKEIKDPILDDLQTTRHDLRNAMQTTVAQIAGLLKK